MQKKKQWHIIAFFNSPKNIYRIAVVAAVAAVAAAVAASSFVAVDGRLVVGRFEVGTGDLVVAEKNAAAVGAAVVETDQSRATDFGDLARQREQNQETSSD